MNHELGRFGPFSQELQIDDIVDDIGRENKSDYVPGPRVDIPIHGHADKLSAAGHLVAEVIEEFAGEELLKMELLATTHFVQHSAGSERSGDIARTLREVKAIKGSKFSDDEISRAIATLNAKGFASDRAS